MPSCFTNVLYCANFLPASIYHPIQIYAAIHHYILQYARHIFITPYMVKYTPRTSTLLLPNTYATAM